MSAADGSSSDDDDDFRFEAANVGSQRYPVHDCCEFEDVESLRRLIFVPQDEADDDRSSGSDDSGSDQSDASSSDDNDSAVAAHAAAVGHFRHPPEQIATVPVGATAAVAAGMGVNIAPHESGGLSQESDNGVIAPRSATPSEAASPTKSGIVYENGEESSSLKDADTVHMKVSPSTDGDVKTVGQAQDEERMEADTSIGPVCEAAPNEDAIMLPPEKDTEALRINVAVPPTETSKPLKKRKKTKREAKEPTYYCPYDVNERDGDENTPLHVAIHARKLEHVQLLLEAGASVHKRCDGSLPVHTAISMGSFPEHANFSLECIVLLKRYDADLSAKDDSLHTPLYLACAMNLPQVVSYILSDPEGLSTLNARADRSGGRSLHAAAKFDFPVYVGGSPASGTHTCAGGHHHPDGTVSHSVHHIPGLHDTLTGKFASETAHAMSAVSQTECPAVVTQILLSTEGIEIDAQNSIGQTPLHVACSRGNWSVARLLLEAGASPVTKDKRGFTPGEHARKRGMPIPNEMLSELGDPLTSAHGAPVRDLIVDPNCSTLLMCHELCMLHRTCAPIRRDSQQEPPPENVRRLHVLLSEVDGILKSGEFGWLVWENKARRASMADVLKVHDYSYVESISQMCSQIPDHPSAVALVDPDTAVSRWSFEAALRAAGGVCDAVDKVVSGDFRNAFCAVRPPGHHAGPRGIVRCSNDQEGSHGFCLLNNVAIGAAYARSMYRNDGIRKVAIIDFDVHHGNGTEEIIRQLVPTIESAVVRTPFAVGELSTPKYRPWLDETDVNDVFFASTHGYGGRALGLEDHMPQQGGWFYPASGETHTADAIKNPSVVETPNLADFILSQSWTRMGDDSRANCCKIMNCGFSLPRPGSIPGMQRLELRSTYRQMVLPALRKFDPDIIFISAGFDAHKSDTMNFGYVGMLEDDYEWVTEQLVKIANTCCNGRIVSVLEGGYKIHGGIVSPFARSVASHVRALVDGGRSRELYDQEDCNWESQFERHVVEERERKRGMKKEQLEREREMALRRRLEESNSLMSAPLNDAPVAGMEIACADEPSRKRRRKQVDYQKLWEQMKQEEGGAS